MFRSLCLLVLGVSELTTSSALDAPKNVRLASFNMNLQLLWDPPDGGAADLLYTAEFRHPMVSWNAIPGCDNTSTTHCNLSSTVSEFASYFGRVRAQRGPETSNWTDSNTVNLFKHSVIGPPGLALLSRGSILDAVITDPLFAVSSLRSTFPAATFNLSYWREGQQQVRIIDGVRQNRLVLEHLKPLSRYCAEVHIQIDQGRSSRPSETVCESTSSEEAAPWVAAVVTAVVMVVLVALLVVAVQQRRKISHFLCPDDMMPEHWKEYLLTPPSAILPATCDSPTPEVYDPVSIVEQPEVEVACSDCSSDCSSERT